MPLIGFQIDRKIYALNKNFRTDFIAQSWKLVQDRFPLKEGELSSQIKIFKPNLHFYQPALT